MSDVTYVFDPLREPYSVLLECPDTGIKPFYCWVMAASVSAAIGKAQASALRARCSVRPELGLKPADFTPLLVLNGHHLPL